MDGWNSDKLSFYLAPFPRYSVRRSIGTKSLYLATPLVFNSPPLDGGVPWYDLR